MASTLTLATLETRVKNMLAASAPTTHWAAASIDEAAAVALEEYSRARPLPVVVVLAANPTTREFTPAGLGSVLNIIRVWFPYTAATPEYPPAWVDFEQWWDSGVLKLLLKVPSVPDGTKVCRVWLNQLHTLSGLAGAGSTSFAAADDGLLVVGTCGYACLQRSTELDETTANMAVSTPNYGALASIFLQQFNDGLKLMSRGVSL